MVAYAVALAGLGAIFWWVRSNYVSEALAVKADLGNFVWMLRQTVQNMGDVTNLLVWWQDYVTAIGLWLICLGFVAAIFLFVLPRAIRTQGWVWLVAVLISALPGLTLPRTNLLLFAVTFWGLFLGTVLVEFARRSRVSALVAAGVMVFVLVTSGWGSVVLQQDSSPANLDWICGNTAWVYGDFSQASVPVARREQMRQQLSQYGIAVPADVGGRLPALVQEAVASSRYGVNAEGKPFVPRLSFITYPDWQPWSCATLKDGLFRVP
jgi:hypothetical protein